MDVSIRPGWFHHQSEDRKVKSLKQLMEIYYGSVGGNAQLLLNLPPTPTGLIHEEDVSRLQEVGEIIRKTFNKDLLEGASQVITTDGYTQIITLTSKEVMSFNTLMLQEDIQEGQRVESFTVEVEKDGAWESVARGTVIGYKKLIRLDDKVPVTTSKVRVHITQSRAVPMIRKVGGI